MCCRQSCCGWLCWLAFFWFAALLWGFSLEELWDVTALRANLVRWRICTNFLTGKLSICTMTAQVWSIQWRNQFHYQFVKLASNASYKQSDLTKCFIILIERKHLLLFNQGIYFIPKESCLGWNITPTAVTYPWIVHVNLQTKGIERCVL